MKTLLLPLLLLASPLVGQATPFDYSRLRLGSLPQHVSKTQLLQRLGKPAKTSRPRYECGSYADEPGHTYYQLHYPQATYVGNATEGYTLETIHFAPGGAVLHYGATTWDASTTLATVQKLFGTDAQVDKQREAGAVVVSIAARIPHTNQFADEWIELTFRHGRLVAYSTGESC